MTKPKKPTKRRKGQSASKVMLDSFRPVFLAAFILWPLVVAWFSGEWGFAWITVALLVFATVAAAAVDGHDGYD